MPGPISVTWGTDAELCVAQAAYVVAVGASCVDPNTEQRLLDPVAGINSRLISASLDVSHYWRRYRLEVLRRVDTLPAAATALAAAGCSEFQVDQMAKAIASGMSECRMEFNRRFPKLVEQLPLRGRPLQERWETVGAGLFHGVRKQVWGDIPSASGSMAKVNGLLVQPMRGGDGDCDAASGRFWVEAMLTDADPSVPEVLRVAWLLLRQAVAADPPVPGDDLLDDRVWSLAILPPLLDTAAQLDMGSSDALPIARAIELWQRGSGATASVVQQWWTETAGSGIPLPVAARQLATRLGPTAMGDDSANA